MTYLAQSTGLLKRVSTTFAIRERTGGVVNRRGRDWKPARTTADVLHSCCGGRACRVAEPSEDSGVWGQNTTTVVDEGGVPVRPTQASWVNVNSVGSRDGRVASGAVES